MIKNSSIQIILNNKNKKNSRYIYLKNIEENPILGIEEKIVKIVLVTNNNNKIKNIIIEIEIIEFNYNNLSFSFFFFLLAYI